MGRKAIFWDNDGVLVDTEILYYRATRQIMAGVGVDLTVDQFRRFFLKESRGAWHLALEKGVPQAEIDRLREERNRLYHELLQREPIEKPGAGTVLQSLAGRVTMAVVTSSRRNHFETIHARTGWAGYFQFVVTGEDVTRTKPDPEPYQVAMRRSECEPADCLAVEDSERGLLAARAAGLRCWVIPTELTRDGDFRQADRVLGHIAEVPAWIHENQ